MPEYELTKMQRMGKKYSEFSQRFKLDSHHAIERLGVVTALFAVSGVAVLGGSAASAYHANQADLSKTALYTDSFTTSRTDQDGEVSGVYTNSDHTRVLVAMDFKEPLNMPHDAANYEAYVTAIKNNVDGKPVKVDQPTVGSIMTFGQTGRLGVMLEAPEGFGEQLLNVTVKSKEEIASVDEDSAGEGYEGLGDSFRTSDQWRVIINPNGSEAVHLDALDTNGTLDAREVYSQAMYRNQEMEQRALLNDTLADMKRQLDRIDTYNASIARASIRVGSDEDVHLVPPRMPDELTGDKIIGLSGNKLTEALETTPPEEIEGLRDASAAAIQMDVYDADDATNSYVLESNKTMPGGFNFNWRTRTLGEGYLKDVVPAGEDPMDYITKTTREGAEARRSVRDIEWTLSNGMHVTDLPRDDAQYKPLMDLYNNAVQAYDGYYKLKRKYQAEQLRDLLLMEVDLDAVARNTEIVSGEDHVSVNM